MDEYTTDLRERASKFLNFVLRHKPDSIGLKLDDSGWADVDELIAKANASDQELTRGMLDEIVKTSDTQRFAVSEDKLRIRANRGHTVPAEHDMPPLTPPDELFHGTASRFLKAIQDQGLLPGTRPHVQLSTDRNDARNLARRHGMPVVLRVDAAHMHAEGLLFYRAPNGVWLTTHVPADRLNVVK